MLHGKMYVINSPELITAAMKNIDISFDPFLIEFSVPLLSLNDKIVKIIEKPVIMQSLMRIIHTSLMGEPLAQLNVAALAKIMETFNNIQPESQLVISDIYTWLWNVTGDATMRALFGEKNPITSQNVQLLAYAPLFRSCCMVIADQAQNLRKGRFPPAAWIRTVATCPGPFRRSTEASSTSSAFL